MGKGITRHAGSQRGQQVLHSEMSQKKSNQTTKHTISPALKSRTNFTRNPKQGYQWPQKKTNVLPKSLKHLKIHYLPWTQWELIADNMRSVHIIDLDTVKICVMLRNIVIKVKLDDVSLWRVCLIGLIGDGLLIELWIFTRNLLRSRFKWTAVWIFSWLRC